MPLNAITISVRDGRGGSARTDFISDLLFELGALSVTVSDLNAGSPDEQAIFDEPPAGAWQSVRTSATWAQARITALYPLSVDVESLVMLIGTEFDLHDTPQLCIEQDVFDEKTLGDWVRHVQASFQPVVLTAAPGARVVRVSFPWHERCHDAGANVVDVRLEPGVAFGTGEHPTTQLCLRWLANIVTNGLHVIDFGCGSGVLAIAACLLAENTSATAVDIDPTAVHVATENAALNGVSTRLEIVQNHQFEAHSRNRNTQADVIVANILARPLMDLCETFVANVRRRGFIAMSGLLVSQAPQVIEHYARHGVKLHDVEVCNGWALVVGVKH